MTYQEFIPTIQQKVQSRLYEGACCDVKEITKNNNHTLNGLVISDSSTNIFPTIYLEGYYEDYKSGVQIDKISADILDQYKKYKVSSFIDVSFFKDYDKVKGHIVFRLVNKEQNKQLLDDVPWIPFLDLAATFYYLIESCDDATASILIHNSHIKEWSVTKDDLFEDAIANTPKLLPYDLLSMKDFFMDMSLPNDDISEIFECSQMYILTNSKRSNGCSCLLYPDILKSIYNEIGCNFFILPSSVHEILILPNNTGYDSNELNNLVQQVNSTQLATEDVLSDHVYFFNSSLGIVSY